MSRKTEQSTTTLKWTKHDKYAVVSECGGYSICSIGFNGGRYYEVHRRRAHPDGPGLVATNITLKDAYRLADEDMAQSESQYQL